MSEIDSRVFPGRREILLRRNAPGRWQPGDIVGFLHRHGDTEQRLVLAAREGRVRSAGGGEATFEIAHANRIDLVVVTFDAANHVLRQFDRRDFLRGEGRGQFDGGPETPSRFGQGALPISFLM